MKNWVRVSESSYLVRTQAGFKQAQRYHVEKFLEWGVIQISDEDSYDGYPENYPSIVNFHDSFEAGKLFANCCNVNEYKQKLLDLIKKVEEAEAESLKDL